VGVQCGIYKGSYNVSNISYLNSLPPLISFILYPPVPGIVSAGIILAYAYMCTHILYDIHPPIPFTCHLLPLISINSTPSPAGPVLPSCSLILQEKKKIKDKKKNMNFFLFELKIATQRISL
jgi:hypothetical protein